MRCCCRSYGWKPASLSNVPTPLRAGFVPQQVLEHLRFFQYDTNGCNFLPDRYNGAARRQAGVVMVTPSVPPQRLPVNLVRSGRKQPQREHCVPGCGWWGCLHNAPGLRSQGLPKFSMISFFAPGSVNVPRCPSVVRSRVFLPLIGTVRSDSRAGCPFFLRSCASGTC